MSMGERPSTEYKLSVNSNTSSRRASLGRSFGDGSILENGDGNETVENFLVDNVRSLNESVSMLDKNLSDLNVMQGNLVEFNESLASLLYGLMCNSCCVLYPQIPADIKEELSTIDKLEALRQQKRHLIEKIKQVRDSGTKREFVTPAMTTSQFKAAQSTNIPYPRHRPNNTRHEQEDIDDTSSEASFVINPSDRLLPPPSSQQSRNTKSRRKSILHTIRKSIASSSDLQPSEETRLGHPTNTKRSRQTMPSVGAATRVISSPRRQTATTKTFRKPPNTEKPPFR